MSEEEVLTSRNVPFTSNGGKGGKAKKKTFVKPDFEANGIYADCIKAKRTLDEKLDNNDISINYIDEVGVFYPEDIRSGTATKELGDKCLADFKTYKENQIALDPDLLCSAKLGIVGAIARFPDKNQQKVCVVGPFCPEMLFMDNEVTNDLARAGIIPKGAVSIPSCMITDTDPSVISQSGARVYRHLHGTDSCKTVAIVFITDAIVSFVPHSKDKQQTWDDFTFGGSATKEAHPKHHILSSEFRTQIDNLDADDRDIVYSLALERGSVFVTHRGMPIAFTGTCGEGETVAAPFMVKTIAFEVPSKGSKRRNLMEQALSTGYVTVGQLHEDFYYKTVPMLAGMPEPDDKNVFCLPRATKTDVPWLFDTRKKAVRMAKTGTPSAPAKKRERDTPPTLSVANEGKEEEKEDDGSAKSMDVDVDEPDPEPAVLKKTKTKKSEADIRLERKKTATTKHAQLKASIATLDPLAWRSNLEENALAKEQLVEEAYEKGELKAGLIKKYEDALNTLESKFNEAVEGQSQLPQIHEMLQTIESILGKVDGMLPPAAKKEINMSKSKRATLDKYKLIKDELFRHHKKIEDHLRACKTLETAAIERVAQLTAPRTNTNTNHVAPIEIPTVNEDELTPHMVQGRKNIRLCLQESQKNLRVFGDAIKVYDSVPARQLYEKLRKRQEVDVAALQVQWREEKKEGKDLEADTLYDFSKLCAYQNAMKEYLELMNTQKSTTITNKKNNSVVGQKRIICENCENEDIKEFNNSEHCINCYSELIYDRKRVEIENRIVKLDQMARKEEEVLGVHGPTQQAWDEFNSELHDIFVTASDEFQEGPSIAKWNKLNDLLTKVDAILPEGDVVSDEDEWEEEEDEGGGAQKKGSLQGVLSLKNLPDDEDSASFSDSEGDDDDDDSSNNGRDRKRGRNDENSLSDRALNTMRAIRVISVWDKILERHGDPKKHALLDAYLDELKSDVKYTYAIKVESVHEEENDVPASEHHTHFLDQNAAMAEKRLISVPGEIRATISKHEVMF